MLVVWLVSLVILQVIGYTHELKLNYEVYFFVVLAILQPQP